MKLFYLWNVKEEFHFTTPKQSTLSASLWEQNSGSIGIYSPKLFHLAQYSNLTPNEIFFFLFLHV